MAKPMKNDRFIVKEKSGSFSISAEGDGISAAAWMQLEAGSYDILAGGGWENGEQHTSENWGTMGGGMGPGGMMPGGGYPGGGGRPSGRPGQNGAQATNMATSSPVQTAADGESTSIKGIKAGGNLIINGGDFAINAADDAVHTNADLTVTDGDFQISTGDDGFHADGTLRFAGGTVAIAESYEGLEALHLQVAGGDITLKATDDGLNAAGGNDQSGMGGRDQYGRPGGFGGASNGSILISGGKLTITAHGDGIDANGTLEISGGTTTVCGPTQGDTATLDYDKAATISGGAFIGTGATGMGQGVIALRVSGSAGTEITVADSSGKVLVSHTPELDFALVIISTPELQKGESYTVSVGNQAGQFQAS